MAERGETGLGRMAEPLEIVTAAEALLHRAGALSGRRVLVTSGPTSEPIDPVRFIANRSSGKQGHAIAAAAAAAGADVVLVSGPVAVPDPAGVAVVKVETARQMLEAVEKALPADVAIFAAAVADWRAAEPSTTKIKKQQGRTPTLKLIENPDILSTIAHRKSGAAAARHRLCRRNRSRHRQCQDQARQEGLRLDPRQRCFAGDRHHGRRQQHHPLDHAGGCRVVAAPVEG